MQLFCLRLRGLMLALAPWLVVGCDNPTAATDSPTPETTILPTARYAPRRDFLVIAIPEGAPTHWHAPGYPPTRSLRLYPHGPDADLVAELRKQLNKNIFDPTDPTLLQPVQADRINRLLEVYFGTPAAPRVSLPSWETVVATATVRLESKKSLGAILKSAQSRLRSFPWDVWYTDWHAATAAQDQLRLDDATLARGSVVYRRWCMQCHGPSGAGEPAHAVVNGPMPRDYRQGLFKYTRAFPPANVKKKGQGAAGKPLRTDLARVIRNGINGTIMPAFPTLTAQELEDVVSYVIHLSIRGETEFATMAKITNVGKLTEDDPDFFGGELDWLLMQNYLWVLINWGIAAQNPIPIPPEPFTTEDERIDSAIRGFRLYQSAEFGCASCHADYGRAPQLKWDAWGTIVQPRNLTVGVYRGGGRGEDLYARLYGGIVPSGMTAFHEQLKKTAAGAPDPLWDIVHFLQALGDPGDRRRMQEKDPTIRFDP
ncbi:MAG: cytochrome c [Gemmataceae bacterium]|nr:cytochrome c [Gemmata sp.]MDW8197146.1 cytochrome c [Gemmataceae bacterium]